MDARLSRYRSRMRPGRMRFWTPTNIASILGDASAASSCSSGSRRISDSATASASVSFRQIDGDTVRPLAGQDDALPPLAELRMAEHELVRPDGGGDVRNRRLADVVAVDRDVSPRARVHAQGDLRRIDAHAGRRSRGDLDVTAFLIIERAVGEEDVVAPRSDHDSRGAA